jgi:hypothetical protein
VVVQAGCSRTSAGVERHEAVREVIFGSKQRDLDFGGIHVHSSSNPIKHSLERCFASVVTIREVLRCGQHNFGLKESMRPNQTAKTYEGPVNPISLFLSNRQLRLRESKHAELYTRPFIDLVSGRGQCFAFGGVLAFAGYRAF